MAFRGVRNSLLTAPSRAETFPHEYWLNYPSLPSLLYLEFRLEKWNRISICYPFENRMDPWLLYPVFRLWKTILITGSLITGIPIGYGNKNHNNRVWRRRVSIPVPLACKASALPFELHPRLDSCPPLLKHHSSTHDLRGTRTASISSLSSISSLDTCQKVLTNFHLARKSRV